jgi:hypothetical protein
MFALRDRKTAAKKTSRLPSALSRLYLESLEDRYLLSIDLALNPLRTGYPHPLESDHGWGGGSDPWEIVDGARSYSAWYHGLAFTGGDRNWAGEPAGFRQVTIDFNQPKTFNRVVIWHHGLSHVPATAQIDYWDGSGWVGVANQRVFGAYHEEGSGSGSSDSDEYTFLNPVTGSKVRYGFDNHESNFLHPEGDNHGWIYEFEVWGDAGGGNQDYTVSNLNDTGPGSLRQAIVNANNHPGRDTITFNIPGPGVHTISPTLALPPLTDEVSIDGYTQPGASSNTLAIGDNAVPLIELNGASAGASGTGFRLITSNSRIRGLAINRFGDSAIDVNGDGNVIEGNYIGVDATGTIARPNHSGVVISGAHNTIGGTTPAARNVISGNTFEDYWFSAGIRIQNDRATDNVVQGNFIGTDVTGTRPLGNAIGVLLHNARNNTIGGTAPGAGNVIAGQYAPPRGYGIAIEGTIGGSAATGNRVEGNFIGTNAAGSAALGNALYGVLIADAPNTTIGGTAAGARNVISGNGADGILVIGAAATGTVVQGNFIGLNATGTAALGNGGWGVFLGRNSSNSTVGGTTTAARNVISGNFQAGIRMDDVMANVVQGNYIGTDVTGTLPLGNTIGVQIYNARNNLIGGTVPGAGNSIGYNGGSGVFIAFGVNNGIRQNAIFSNGGLGIDLGNVWYPDGVTPNDDMDPDEDANHLQNFPVLATAFRSGSRTFVRGVFNSTPATLFTLEFFVSAAGDPSGYGEGQQFLFPPKMVLTDDLGNATYTFIFPVAVPVGQFITATATDPDNNTSEFSPWVVVVPESAPPSGGASAARFATVRQLNDQIAVSGPMEFGLGSGATLPAATAPMSLGSQPGRWLPGEEHLVSQMLSTRLRTEEFFSTGVGRVSALGNPMAGLNRDVLDLLAVSRLANDI